MSHASAVDAGVELGMEAALDCARRGFELEGEVPIGAATVRNGVVTSARHTEEVKQRRRLVHADLHALQDADLPGLSIAERAATALIITLEPCLLCIGAAMTFGIGRVHFAIESPIDGGVRLAEEWGRRLGALDGFAVPEISSGFRRDESVALLREFATSRSSGGLWRWTRDTLERIDANS